MSIWFPCRHWILNSSLDLRLNIHVLYTLIQTMIWQSVISCGFTIFQRQLLTVDEEFFITFFFHWELIVVFCVWFCQKYSHYRSFLLSGAMSRIIWMFCWFWVSTKPVMYSILHIYLNKEITSIRTNVNLQKNLYFTRDKNFISTC